MTAPLDTDGPAAPPRSNGELVFSEPWESRAFGMAVTLADAGAFTWDEFRGRLVARIAAWQAERGVDDPLSACSSGFRYYACWLDALEDLLVDAGALACSDVTERSAAFATRSAGHDHRHGAHGH